MRPSWPPPRIPMVLPCGSGEASDIVGWKLGDGSGLVGAEIVERRSDLRIGEREDRCSQQGGIDGAGATDGESAHRNAGRHLDDREEAILAAERRGLRRYAK